MSHRDIRLVASVPIAIADNPGNIMQKMILVFGRFQVNGEWICCQKQGILKLG